ncbi:dna helicase subunit adda [Lucifera butyrica]|uniref:ATP-dependent helicase/nuclease subunit A n=1 Tax=Lucifera butyrica TaxID=1351585 RepID=A0A498R2Q9_9FIRM|nr:helicase-exonuclease AddAB subunit AddA [Lucifera butyrica]VBB05050.1 dna helicase subunit adda [Lucifera butyrica]
MTWSPEQLAAIQARNQNVLVAAAAGSGKTSVLVERIIQRVLDTREPVNIDRMLVVTFTNAAAAEMRERVEAALTAALHSQPRAAYLERQLLLLSSASICTIHAFCQSVVRQYFHLLDLDPKFRIGEEGELELMRLSVLEELFEAKYAAQDAAFLQFVDHYGEEKSDQSLYQLVLGLYEYSRSHPWPQVWLEKLAAPFALSDDADIDHTPWSTLLRDKFILELSDARLRLVHLAAEAQKEGNPSAYARTFTDDIGILDDLLLAAGRSWESLYAALQEVRFSRLAPAGKDVAEERKDYFQQERNQIKALIKEYQESLFCRTAAELLQDMRSMAPVIRTLSLLTAEFAENFSQAKRRKGLVDFSDLEHFCLAVLREEASLTGETVPSAVARELREKYQEVMIDEYQDTNEVQETILKLVSRPDRPNLFMVGDVKQSIYRFRLAEPELFLAKYRSYPAGERGENRRIDLSRNFRSRPGILQVVNFLFRQLMHPAVAELSYGDAESLHPGPDFPFTEYPNLAGAVDFYLIDRENAKKETADSDTTAEETAVAAVEELSGFELEAALIIRKMKEYMNQSRRVYDKKSQCYRPLAWRDMVVLLRSVQNKAGVLLDFMRREGIPAYAELEGGYFQEVEVQVILSLLSVIDNPRQDIHLAGVFRSPLVGLTAEELAGVRLAEPGGDLWDAVKQKSAQNDADHKLVAKLNRFLTLLRNWQDLSCRQGVPELIWRIYRDTGYYEYVGGMPGGMFRQANLRAMYDRARQYESTSFRGLFRFLRFIDRLRDKGTDLSVARALGESEDVVRIMSIHKSKGLEFPVVFLADLGKQINLQDSRGLVLRHKKLGVGPYATFPELRLRYPTLARYGIAWKLTLETKAEELRILYVAMTRAREKLVLIGSAGKLSGKCAKWRYGAGCRNPVLPAALIAGARTYLDWLCPAVMRHADGKELRAYGGDSREEDWCMADADGVHWGVQIIQADDIRLPEAAAASTDELLEKVRRLEPLEEAVGTAWVEEILSWRYACGQAVGKPAKLSVTEMKRRFEVSYEGDSRPVLAESSLQTRPRFIQQKSKLTATETGVLMHTVMQHLRLEQGITAERLQAQLEEMVAREILLPEYLSAVDQTAILAFFTRPLGRRLLAARNVRREVPFSFMLPAERFYPELTGYGERIFIQGVIDCLFREEDGLVLVDYKTDRRQGAAELRDKYALQLSIYGEAAESILKEKVKEKYLYVFSTGEAIRIGSDGECPSWVSD